MNADERARWLASLSASDLAKEFRAAIADSVPPRPSADRRCQAAWAECIRRNNLHPYLEALEAVRAERRAGEKG